MNTFAQLVLLIKLFVFLTEINSLMVFPKKENDSLSSAAGYHYGLKPPPPYRLQFSKPETKRKHYRPANVAYKVRDNYPSITTERYFNNLNYRLPVKKEKPKKQILKHRPERIRVKEKITYKYPKKWAAPVANAIEEQPTNYNNPKRYTAQVSNAVEEDTSDESEEDTEHDVPAPQIDPAARFPSFGGETPKRGRIYSKPGEWATPSPDSGIETDFTPVQTYLQVRKTNTVMHVPQSEAFKDATSYEEVLNAPRLKEVLRTTKIQEVYSEEGYEDTGYDHAGHERHAEHDEGYAAQDQAQFRLKELAKPENDDNSNEETRDVPLMRVKNDVTGEENQKEASNIEPKITRSRTETSSTSVEYAKSPKKYKGSHKFSSKIKSRLKDEENSKSKVKVKGFKFPPTEKPASEVWAVPTVFDELSTETPPGKFENDFKAFTPKSNQNPFFTIPLEKPKEKSLNKTTKYKPGKYKKLSTTTTTTTTTTTEKPENIKAIEKQIKNYSSKYLGSPSNSNQTGLDLIFSKGKEKYANKTSKYHNLFSKFPKRVRIEPFKPKKSPSKSASNIKEFVFESDEDQQERPDKRIVLPTIGYINSLTSAHFGKERNNSNNKNEDKTPLLTTALNLTEALNYLRFNGFKPNPIDAETVATGIPHFEPMKLKKNTRVKRDLTNTTESQKENIEGQENEDSEIVHDKKNDEIAEEERKRIEEENKEKEKYEKELNEEITQQEKKILGETLGNLGVKDISEKFPSLPSGSILKPEDFKLSTTPMPIDRHKYPFYFSKNVPRDSPLRYATNPRYFPRKSGYRMEFYESRDRLIHCPDVNINLESIPKSNSTKDLKTQPGENQRIVGLGDKISCLKMKYFDEDPLDSPFFREKEIDYVGKTKPKHHPTSSIRKYPVSAPSTVNPVRKIKRNGAKAYSPVFNESLRYHSSYTYQPNKTLQIMIKDQNVDNNAPQGNRVKFHSNENKTQNETSVAETKRIPSFLNKTREDVKDRVIPVKEQIDEVPSNYFIRTSGKLAVPYPPRRKIIRPNYYRLVSPVKSTKIITTPNKVIIPHNCMHMISKMGAMADERNLIVDCKDATLIQEIRNGAKHIKILPKYYEPPKITPKPAKIEDFDTREKLTTTTLKPMQKKNIKPRARIPFSISIKETYQDQSQSDWIPMVSYPPAQNTLVSTAAPHRFGRKSDELIITPNESNTSSNHYIIDELKEDEDVRKGEVIEDKAHVFNLMNETETESGNETVTTTEAFESLKTEPSKREKREAIGIENLKKGKKSKLFLDKKLLDQIHEKKPVKKSLDDVTDLGINSPDDFTEKITIHPLTNDATEITTTLLTPKIQKPEKPPLKRLSGKDFLTRYHKNKGNPNKKEKPWNEFWKVDQPTVVEPTTENLPTTTKTQNLEETTAKSRVEPIVKTASAILEKKITERNSTGKVEEEQEPIVRGGRYVQGTDGPILYYVVDKKTGRGRWLTNYEENKKKDGNLKVRSDLGKDSEFEKMNYGSKNDRKVQKQKIRKNFFKRRLNKSTSESNAE